MDDAVSPIYAAEAPRLRGLAYRILGSRALADELVQEAFLRLERHLPEVVEPAAWLTTAVTRLALDELKSARARRERYVGPWLPEPVLTPPPADAEGALSLAEDLSLAFLMLLETLSPEERVVFLLREAFGEAYSAIAATLGKSEAACRQIHRRARGRLQLGQPRFEVTVAQQQAVLGRMVTAIALGDRDGLTQLLSDDVVMLSDGGGKVSAARRPLEGPHRVREMLLGLARKAGPTVRTELAWVGGAPGVAIYDGERLTGILTLATDGRQIQGVYLVLNPEKLSQGGMGASA